MERLPPRADGLEDALSGLNTTASVGGASEVTRSLDEPVKQALERKFGPHRLTVSIDEVNAAGIFPVSRTQLYRSAHQFLTTGHGLPVIRCGGRRMVVSVPALARLLSAGELPEAAR